MLEPQLLLPPVKFRIFGPKKGKFGQNWHFWPNIGLFGPFDPLSDQKTMQKGAQVVFRCVGTKTFASSCKNYDFWPQNSHFRPKICFLQHIQALRVHLAPCRLVGWWLSCAGCISQDTYLLYYGAPIQANNKTIGLNISYPSVWRPKLFREKVVVG